MTIKTLFDFTGPLETISFSDLAVALGCDESTIKIWLKDETIKMPKPLQIGENMWFSYEEVKNWLQSRPKFNCFYDINQDKIEILDSGEYPVNIDGLMNEKIALECLQQVLADFRERPEFLQCYYAYIPKYLADLQQHNKASSDKTGIIISCIVIDSEIKLVLVDQRRMRVLLENYEIEENVKKINENNPMKENKVVQIEKYKYLL
ncbi:helix-turn-helix transcriptional regulator [Gilliamella sp. wkB112]|uniref:helix-turn-helix transcriptional regulator n=1 Tax=Gilliamella sp. wkB112 TaxID=3120257 RepID=UPI00080DBFDF|nr:hypothetical protein [Gilliamella apicola]OCG02899.1 hypothetical protein A9G12_08190 [Gilliamella apicola]